MPAEILRVQPVYEGWAKYLVATVRLADGAEVAREIEDHGRAVCVLPYDPERQVALLTGCFGLLPSTPAASPKCWRRRLVCSRRTTLRTAPGAKRWKRPGFASALWNASPRSGRCRAS